MSVPVLEAGDEEEELPDDFPAWKWGWKATGHKRPSEKITRDDERCKWFRSLIH